METNLLVIPRLPAIDLEKTRIYMENVLGFSLKSRYPEYLLMNKGDSELHFFLFKDLDPLTNYSMVYIRVEDGIEKLYEEFKGRGAIFPAAGHLEAKPWGTKEFAVLDPNHTLFTYGQLA